MRTHTLVSVAALALGACAGLKPVKPPPAVSYGLAGARATYRPYQQQHTLCAAEPRWLFDELASVNNLLDRFVDDTAPRSDGSLSDVQMLKLEEGVQTLPEVLDAHEKNLALLEGCGFASQRGFPVLVKRGRSYAREARRRLEDAPRQIAEVKHREALAEWRERVGREKVTLQLGCPRRSRAPIVYFAWQDEQGAVTWLFCDGSKVVAEKGGAPTFEASPMFSARELKRAKPARWLSAAKQHPKDGIMRPPEGAATATIKAW